MSYILAQLFLDSQSNLVINYISREIDEDGNYFVPDLELATTFDSRYSAEKFAEEINYSELTLLPFDDF